MSTTFPVTSDLTSPGLGGDASAKSVLSSARGLSASLPEVLGAIGISAVLLIGAAVGIGAAVNFGQDSSAKSTLDSIKSAEVLYQSKNQAFGALTDLTTGDTPPLTVSPANAKINATATNYCAVIKSGSMAGPTYWITAKSGAILETAPTAAQTGDASCPTLP